MGKVWMEFWPEWHEVLLFGGGCIMLAQGARCRRTVSVVLWLLVAIQTLVCPAAGPAQDAVFQPSEQQLAEAGMQLQELQ